VRGEAPAGAGRGAASAGESQPGAAGSGAEPSTRAGAAPSTRARVAPSGRARRVAELLREADRAVALTGAGVSVPSGIPDFRSPGTGLWENVDPMEVAHIDAWRRDPDRFWSFYSRRFASLTDKQPNEAHLALAELERRGLIRGVITQNIDRLHRLAGTQRLVEVHGSIEWSVCLDCGGRVALDRVLELLGAGERAPECPTCVAPLKPDVVLFGELLPERALAEAQELALEADLMLCVGSSLEVYPVAGLPAIAHGAGGRLVLITRSSTPYDGDAEVKLDGDVVDELLGVLAAL
jgi:NAD-dependent deacetylase